MRKETNLDFLLVDKNYSIISLLSELEQKLHRNLSISSPKKATSLIEKFTRKQFKTFLLLFLAIGYLGASYLPSNSFAYFY